MIEIQKAEEVCLESDVLLVPKKDGSQRPGINLKKLNKHVHTKHFKMEGSNFGRTS